MMKYFKILFVFSISVLLLCGCGDNEHSHPLLKKAAQSKRLGEYRNAELCYKKYLAKNPSSVQVHLEMAELYDEFLEEYISAIYHYKEALRLAKDGDNIDRKAINGFIEHCEQRYFNPARKGRKKMLTDEEEILRLTEAYNASLAAESRRHDDEIDQLQKSGEVSAPAAPVTAVQVVTAKVETAKPVSENKPAPQTLDAAPAPEKKAENSVISPAPVAEAAAPAAPVEKKAVVQEAVQEKSETPAQVDAAGYPKLNPEENKAPEIIEYVVRKNDTLTHLSRRFYGSIRYYKKLMQYNNITNAGSLRIGQKLKIPPLEILKGEKNEK